jgi:hypothetical protein
LRWLHPALWGNIYHKAILGSQKKNEKQIADSAAKRHPVPSSGATGHAKYTKRTINILKYQIVMDIRNMNLEIFQDHQ